MEIEDCKFINGWLLVNSNHDLSKNDWKYQFFGKEHSISEAHELYISYQPERLSERNAVEMKNPLNQPGELSFLLQKS